jgi:hypothetical protein
MIATIVADAIAIALVLLRCVLAVQDHCISQIADELTIEKCVGDETHLCYDTLIKKLAPLAQMPPHHAINESCEPPALVVTDDVCAAEPEALSGRLRADRARVAVVIDVGFEADVLEIALREYHGVVDRVFIVESTRTHYQFARKPLTWDHLRHQKRFGFFDDTWVVHIVLDDVESMDGNVRDGIWTLEKHMNRVRVQRFLHWNEQNRQFFRDTDLVSFAATDEIASRKNIELLKRCELKAPADRVIIGSWFMMGDTSRWFMSYAPLNAVPDRLVYAAPMFHAISNLRATHGAYADGVFSRQQASLYLFGGIHMTDYTYLPYKLLKDLTATEYGMKRQDILTVLARLRDDVLNYEVEQVHDKVRTDNAAASITVEEAMQRNRAAVQRTMHLPWFFVCNRARYPQFDTKHDSRVC